MQKKTMTRWTITLFLTATLASTVAQGQTKNPQHPDSCNIQIGGHFCINCPKDTSIQGWIIISSEKCRLDSMETTIYSPKDKKVIYKSTARWEGKPQNKSCYCPRDSYPYSILFFINGQIIKKTGTVSLLNYSDNTCKDK